jgi:hypothetical protein
MNHFNEKQTHMGSRNTFKRFLTVGYYCVGLHLLSYDIVIKMTFTVTLRLTSSSRPFLLPRNQDCL